jgi:hypothetical protein
MLYLLGLWTDQIPNQDINHPNIAQNVREKYMKRCIHQIPIGQIGLLRKVRFFV